MLVLIAATALHWPACSRQVFTLHSTTSENTRAESPKTDPIHGALIACAVVWWMAGLYLYLSPKLPEESALRNITLRTPMRVLSSDGALIGQFGEQKRKPLQYADIPQSFIDALLAAEDDGFFEHHGIEPLSLLRAVSELILTGRKGSGGSRFDDAGRPELLPHA